MILAPIPYIIAADADYALDLCRRIAALTDVPGTITRLFLSLATLQVHALLRAEMAPLGMAVRMDSAGNLRSFYPAAAPDAPVLLMGSHIDTVPDAGAFDGVLGVALALAAVRSLGGRRLPYAIEIIAFSEEEGVRFRLPFLGSRALAGTLDNAARARTDEEGISVAEAMRSFVTEATDPAPLPRTFGFFEMHIEQGPVLESLGIPLGIVTTIVGQTRLQLTFRGQANHAGTTPMHLRHDSLTAAAEFILAAEKFAREQEGIVATVGMIRAMPGAPNIIPGETSLSLDLRHADDQVRHASTAALLRRAEEIGTSRGVIVTSFQTSEQAAAPMDAGLRDALTEAAAAARIAAHTMVSGAGHDAMIVAQVLPAAMLFLRTPGGLSHHPNEAVSHADVQAALETCMHFLHLLNPVEVAISEEAIA